MIFRILLLTTLTISACYCHDSGSAEANKIETTPLYDTIIFSDVADIFNEFENGMNPIETLFNSGSDSEENLEDLLIEYQHYLDRAHSQHLKYLEKTNTKNKIPLTRHDRFAKTKPAGGMKYEDYFFSGNYANPSKLSQTQYGAPLDVFMPNEKLRFIGKTNFNTALPKEYPIYEKNMLDLSPIIPKPTYDPIKSSCFCKSAELPCDCKCKQCLIYDSALKIYNPHPKYMSGDSDKALLPNTDHVPEDKLGEDNTVNIRIKVDIQLPKTKEIFTKLFKTRSREESNSKDTTVSVPFSYFNFPIPLDVFGYKNPLKASTHDSTHKITIHKKKKSRANNGSKKHKKKVIAYNLNIKPQHAKLQPYFEETTNTSTDYNERESMNQTSLNSTIAPMTTQAPESVDNKTTTVAISNAKENNETQLDESIFVTVNISNSSDNGTEDAHKIENSVETEYKGDKNIPTERLFILRKKRDTSTTNLPTTLSSAINADKKIMGVVKKYTVAPNSTPTPKINHDNKKLDKILVADSELLYWPINKNLTDYISNNITTIILEREDKKAKLNMTKEAIRNNRTTALEKAIFGNVNWDDVDTVAPVFLSFVGKYLTGVLTFCSQNVCHSMNCTQKTCVHRICHPSDRWNQRGHCVGSNKTDSVASLESIMDLPSNVAFEIVDILQDKMLGKLFGKVTLCINSKCITFVAVKKNFLKSKCSVKDLKTEHCPNLKNYKIM